MLLALLWVHVASFTDGDAASASLNDTSSNNTATGADQMICCGFCFISN